MAGLIEIPQWEEQVYQLETTDPVLGGPDGIDNLQARQLACRTLWLREQLAGLGDAFQPLSALLTALAALSLGPNQLIYSTGAEAFAAAPLSAFMRELLASSDAAVVLQELAAAPLDSPSFTGVPSVPTAAPGSNTGQAASTAFVQAAIAALVGSSPAALDTLNELAAALGNDADFATTVTNALAARQPLSALLTGLAALSLSPNQLIYSTGAEAFAAAPLSAFMRELLASSDAAAALQELAAAPLDSPSFTGVPSVPTAAPGTSSGQAASTAFVQAAVAAAAASGSGAWQNVTAQRVLSTSYTNTGATPLIVSVSCASAINQDCRIYVGGVEVERMLGGSQTGSPGNVSAWVPPGASYMVSSQSTLVLWTEFTFAGGVGGTGALQSAAPVVAVAAARTLGVVDAGCYLRCSSDTPFTVTVAPQSSALWANNVEITLRGAGNGRVTLAAGVGVSIIPPAGGTLALDKGMTATLKRVAPDVWDLIGQVVAA